MSDATLSPLPLDVENLSLTLPSAAGPVEILRGLNVQIGAGERVAVVGPSGSGKSSLISVAAGLEQPTGGRVLLFGQDLGRLNEDGRARLAALILLRRSIAGAVRRGLSKSDPDLASQLSHAEGLFDRVSTSTGLHSHEIFVAGL